MSLENLITDIAVSPKASIDEFMPFIINEFEDKWKHGYKYDKSTLKRYKGGELSRSITLGCVMVYCSQSSSTFFDKTKMPGPQQLNNKAAHWESKGGLCIYISVLSYCLLIELGVSKPNELQLIQGFYRHDLREDWPEMFPLSKTHIGLHSFLTHPATGAVIDCTIISQEGMFYDFGKYSSYPFIFGPVPEDFELWGWPEDYKTAKEYARMFARQCGMVYYDWIALHKTAVIDIAKAVSERR